MAQDTSRRDERATSRAGRATYDYAHVLATQRRREVNQRRAIIVAGHAGDEAAVRGAVADADPVVRTSALSALHRMGALDDSGLASALGDPDYRVRRRAAELAAQFPSVDITVLLSDPDDRVVEMAAWASGEREDPPAKIVDRLSQLAIGHDDALVREAAIAALGAIGDERGLLAILHGVNDKPAIRRRAVIALAPFEGPEVDAAYAKALKDRDWQVRQAAEDLAD
jgi:HEAT repeat protein